MSDVTITLTDAEARELLDNGSVSGNLRAKVATATGEAFDATAPKLRCRECGYAGLTDRTKRDHVAMHVSGRVPHDQPGDVLVTDAHLAEMIEPI